MRKKIVENYESLPEEEILALINNGKYELIGIIINHYLPVILHYVKKYCSENEAEDRIQEATMALYTAVKNYDPSKSSFNTFADLCIKRSVISGLKYANRKKNIPDELVTSIDCIEVADTNSPEKIFFDKENYKTLTDTIKFELSGLEYKVLQHYLSGDTYSDIAVKLSITEKSVDNALMRIRKKLKDK